METWVRRTSGDQSLLGEDYFQLAVAFGRGAAVCSTRPPLAISTPPPSPCGRGGKRRLRRRSLRSEEHQLGISRHERQEFRHDEIFEVGTQTSSAALGHCQSLVVVVIVLLRLLLPLQG